MEINGSLGYNRKAAAVNIFNDILIMLLILRTDISTDF